VVVNYIMCRYADRQTDSHICTYIYFLQPNCTLIVYIEAYALNQWVFCWENLIKESLKSSVFRDMMPCSLLKVKWNFWGTFCLHLQCRRIRKARLYLPPAFKLVSCLLILWPWRWRWHVPTKCQLTFNGLHGLISQKVELFISTAVRTKNPIKELLLIQSCDLCNTRVQTHAFLIQ
jgi:hypothetical protein